MKRIWIFAMLALAACSQEDKQDPTVALAFSPQPAVQGDTLFLEPSTTYTASAQYADDGELLESRMTFGTDTIASGKYDVQTIDYLEGSSFSRDYTLALNENTSGRWAWKFEVADEFGNLTEQEYTVLVDNDFLPLVEHTYWNATASGNTVDLNGIDTLKVGLNLQDAVALDALTFAWIQNGLTVQSTTMQLSTTLLVDTFDLAVPADVVDGAWLDVDVLNSLGFAAEHRFEITR